MHQNNYKNNHPYISLKSYMVDADAHVSGRLPEMLFALTFLESRTKKASKNESSARKKKTYRCTKNQQTNSRATTASSKMKEVHHSIRSAQDL